MKIFLAQAKMKCRNARIAIEDFIHQWFFLGLFILSIFIYVSAKREWPKETNFYIDLIPEFVWAPFIFYFLFYIREKRINRNLKYIAMLAYHNFKTKVIMQFQFLLEGGSSDPEPFLDLVAFRKEFGENRWYQIANGVEEKDLQVFRGQARFLREELTQLLGAKRTTSKKAFMTLKGFSWCLFELESSSGDYDDRKRLLRQLWSIFSGWDVGSGYTNKDLIEKAIHDL